MSGGRRQKIGWSVSLEIVQGVPRRWRIFLPRFGADGHPIPGARREVVCLDLRLTRQEVEAQAKRLYLDRLSGKSQVGPVATRTLLSALLDYFRLVTEGPIPKAAATAEIDRGMIVNVALWLRDRAAGCEESPRAQEEVVPAGTQLRDLPHGPDLALEHFTRPELLALRDYWARRVGATSVNMRLSHLRAALSWMVDQGWIPASPFRRGDKLPAGARTKGATTPPADTRKRHLTLPELRRLDGALSGEVRRWVRLSYLTGSRSGEIIQLRPACADPEEGMLRIPAGKTKSRSVLLIPPILAELAGWGGWQHRPDWYAHRVSLALAQLGIDVAQPLHCLRHTFTTLLSARGIPREDYFRWTGHSTGGPRQMLGAYDHAHLEALQRVAAAIPIPWLK